MSTEKTPTVYATKLPSEEKTPKERKINCTKFIFIWLLVALLVALIVALCVQFLVPVKKYEPPIDEVHVYDGKPIEIGFKSHSNSNGPIVDDMSSPPWHLDFLINPTRLCDTLNAPHSESYLKDPEVKLLMLVPSAVSHFQHRMTIRKTWGSVADRSRGPFRLGFVLGTSANSTEEDRIKEESEKYGDIIQADFEDTYRNLTTKSVLMLKWVSKHCPHAQYFLKADDDTFVNMGQLIRLLQQPPFTTNDKFIGGFIHRGDVPSRNPITKYYMTEYDYYYDDFPPYASGSAYVTNGATASKLFEATKRVKPFLPMEDVFVTGLCGDSIDATLIHEPSFRHHDPPKPLLWDTYRSLTTVHSISPDDMDDLWKQMTQSLDDMLGWSDSSESSDSRFYPVSSEFSDSSSDFFWSWPGRKSLFGDSDWDSSEMDVLESSKIEEGVANKGKTVFSPLKIIQEDIFGPTFLSVREIKPKGKGVTSNKGQAVLNPFEKILKDIFPHSVVLNSEEFKPKTDRNAANREQTVFNPFRALLEDLLPPRLSNLPEVKPKTENDLTNKGQAAIHLFQLPNLEDYLPPRFPNFQGIKPMPEKDATNKGQAAIHLFQLPNLEDYLPPRFPNFQEIKPMPEKDATDKGKAAIHLFQLPNLEDYLPPRFPNFQEIKPLPEKQAMNNLFKLPIPEDFLPPHFLNFPEIELETYENTANKEQTVFNPFMPMLENFFPPGFLNFQENKPKTGENKANKAVFKPLMPEELLPLGFLNFQEIKPKAEKDSMNKAQTVFNPFMPKLEDFFPPGMINFQESKPKIEENRVNKARDVFDTFKPPMLEDFFPPGFLTSQDVKPKTIGDAANKGQALFNPFKMMLDDLFPPRLFNFTENKPKALEYEINKEQNVSSPLKLIHEDLIGPFFSNFQHIKPNVRGNATTKGQIEPSTYNWIDEFPGPNFLNWRISKDFPSKQTEKGASVSPEKQRENKISPLPLNGKGSNGANNTRMFFQ